MNRINVVGTSGSGKSSFSKSLAEKLGYPYIQLDQLFWLPNWQESADEEFLVKIATALDRPTWVLDGNYKRTIQVKWKDVDTVIWLDYTFGITLWRAIKRALTRIVSKKEAWPNTGNVETWSRLFSRESVVLWTIKTHHRNRRVHVKYMQEPQFQHITFYRFRKPKEALDFLKGLEASTFE